MERRTRDGALMMVGGALLCVLGVVLLLRGGDGAAGGVPYGSPAYSGRMMVGLGILTLMVGAMTFFGSRRAAVAASRSGNPAEPPDAREHL